MSLVMALFSVGQKSGLFLARGASRKESILEKKQNIRWRVVGIQGWKPMNKAASSMTSRFKFLMKRKENLVLGASPLPVCLILWTGLWSHGSYGMKLGCFTWSTWRAGTGLWIFSLTTRPGQETPADLLTGGKPKPFAQECFPPAHALSLQAVAVTKALAKAPCSSSIRWCQQCFVTLLLWT